MSTLAIAPRARLVSVTLENPLSAVDERALVERARVDPDAFGELFRRYLPRVHAFAWRRTGSVAAAEDVCSATFEAAFRGLGSYQWRAGGFGPWLFRIAGNQIIAHHRREGRGGTDRGQRAMAHLAPPEPAGDLADELASRLPDERVATLRAALDRLPERYQRAIALRYLADLEPGDAARAMGLAKPAFAVVVSRARKALRRELEREGGTTNG